jgi:radical SAM superfamily enzyme YgiQ (UPF0313 family)
MKICLVFPDVYSFHGIPYHPGLASIAAVLMKEGHAVRLVYYNAPDKDNGIIEEINRFKPDLVGFTAVETQFSHVRRLALKIKEVRACFIVCGGPYATLSPESVLKHAGPIDAAIIGEGEYAMAQLADTISKDGEWRNLRNLAYVGADGEEIVRNPLNPLISDLDSLPFPNTEIFPFQDIIDKHNIAVFHFNRGCPYRCAFCSNEALGNVYSLSANRIRYRSPGSATDEIERTLSKYKLRDDTLLHFGDDLFVFDKKWLSEFCALYRKKIGRPFWCTGRSNHISDEVCRNLKNAGCSTLMMSVESGNDFIRNEVMRRNISRETMVRSFDLCDKHGINTLATCIVGLPFETCDMIEDSIKTVAGLKSITAYGVNTFYPYKGTHLRKICEDNDFMSRDWSGELIERKESVLNLPTISRKQIMYYYKNWSRLVARHKSLQEVIKYEIRNAWAGLRATYFGQLLRSFINNTGSGKAIKRAAMRHVWNKAA